MESNRPAAPAPIRERQRRLYGELWGRYGEDPRSLGHRDRETQFERFARLARAFPADGRRFTVHEIGCGMGDFGLFLADRFPAAVYSGSEIMPQFLDVCRRRFPTGRFHLRDVTEALPDERYDFVTQSGLLNGKMGTDAGEWQGFVFAMLEAMYRMSRRAMGSTFLSSHHDAAAHDPDLHYQEPQSLIDFVVERLSRHYTLDASGPLYEYTLTVLHPGPIRARYDGECWDRYFRRRTEPPPE